MKLAVIDLETSGLSFKPYADGDESPHTPGRHHDCILEVGLIILDAETLKEEQRHEWLVFPPGINDPESFARWETQLREKNAFVHNLHSQVTPGALSLLEDLRVSMTSTVEARVRHGFEDVGEEVIDVLAQYTLVKDDKGIPKPTHPGNSPVMFTGNSIANLDIPMLKFWMPAVHNMLAYRILDVSVLRTFYVDICKLTLPAGLAEAIKSGGGGHRALADAEWCAQSLRELVQYARALK